jgi:hypothetical protein
MNCEVAIQQNTNQKQKGTNSVDGTLVSRLAHWRSHNPSFDGGGACDEEMEEVMVVRAEPSGMESVLLQKRPQ